MKAVIALYLFALVGLNLADSDLYTDKWDNIDVDEILNNYRLKVSYIKCVLDQGPCTVDGQEMKCEYFIGLT